MRSLTLSAEFLALPGNLVLPACHLATMIGVNRKTLYRWKKSGKGVQPLPTGDYEWPVCWYPVHRVREFLTGTPEPAPGPYYSGGRRHLARVRPWHRKGVRKRAGAFNARMKLINAYAEMILEEDRLGLPLSTHLRPNIAKTMK